MVNTYKFEPNWCSAPGETIGEILAQNSLSLDSFASQIGHSKEFVQGLLRGKEVITKELAEILSTHLGATSQFWLSREFEFRAAQIRLGVDSKDEKQEWISSLPLKEMAKLGWIDLPIQKNLWFNSCLEYFGVSDLSSWRQSYGDLIAQASFRTSEVYQSRQGALSAWFRRGEFLAESVDCAEWNPKKFRNKLECIRSFTRMKSPSEFLDKLRIACAESGVAFVVAKAPVGCAASGVAKFLSSRKALILLSFRHLSDDHFWFTFYHEAGHLLLHGNRRTFIDEEDDGYGNLTDEEFEANEFASLFLIPTEHQVELRQLDRNKRAIIKFARKVGVSPGIVVGQLQHVGRLEFRNMNYMKRRFVWIDKGQAILEKR